MTDSDHALDAIARAAAELVPELTERLARHGLGEIEVTSGELRLRVAAGTPTVALAETAGSAPARQADDPASAAPGVKDTAPPIGVSSPAVGFFVYADGLGPGIAVAKGDALGHVEMLGVRHDVRAPRTGTVSHLVAESGEAVEYGQVVLEIEAGDPVR